MMGYEDFAVDLPGFGEDQQHEDDDLDTQCASESSVWKEGV